MKILAVDCAGNACSVACMGDGIDIASIHREMRRGHAEHLVPMMAEVLSEAGIGAQSLDALAVTTGPGAFTGLRIGLAAVQGLALSSKLPVIGITCFDHVLASSNVDGPVLVVLETKRPDFYMQAFDASQNALFSPMAGDFDSLQTLLVDKPPEFTVIGDAAARFTEDASAMDLCFGEQADPEGDVKPSAVDLGRLAHQRIDKGQMPAIGAIPKPLYLRPPDVGPIAKPPRA